MRGDLAAVTGFAVRHAAPVLAIAALAACAESTTGPSVPASLRILSSRAPSDTIDVAFAEQFSAQVLDASGRPVPQALISVSVSGQGPGTWPAVLLGPTPTAVRADFFGTQADDAGIVRFYIHSAFRAGVFYLRLKVGDFRDSIPITIHPGAPLGIDLSPKDTAVFVGTTYAITTRPYDRGTNTTEDSVTFAARRADIASPGVGASVRANGTGRAYVIATARNTRDSVAVSVVPTAHVLAYNGTKLIMMGLDGSDYHIVHAFDFSYNNLAPFFFADGQRVVFYNVMSSGTFGLFTMNTAGVIDTLLVPADTILAAASPQPTRDGSWIYFTAQTGYSNFEVWRLGATGTTPTRVSRVARSPSPSPDGSRLAVVVAAGNYGLPHLAVLDAATGNYQVIAGPFTSSLELKPRWSPVADEIAFFGDSGLTVIRPDGQILLGPIHPPTDVFWDTFDGQIDWSPDGKWLVACRSGSYSGARKLAVIERSTGAVLPLVFTQAYTLCGATWQP